MIYGAVVGILAMSNVGDNFPPFRLSALATSPKFVGFKSF